MILSDRINDYLKKIDERILEIEDIHDNHKVDSEDENRKSLLKIYEDYMYHIRSKLSAIEEQFVTVECAANAPDIAKLLDKNTMKIIHRGDFLITNNCPFSFLNLLSIAF